MRYTACRVGLKRTVQPRQYESVTFELAVDVELGEGLDPADPAAAAAFQVAVRRAYEDVAALIVAERKRRLKQVDDVVVVGEKISGRPVVDVPLGGN